MNAIATTYKGVRFRSRLEAKWAAFFDAVGWTWEYEPIDLEGYIPDFILPDMATPLLVEVKPAMTLGELQETAVPKVEASGWEYEAMLVGGRIYGHSEFAADDSPSLGLLSQWSTDGPSGRDRWWADASVVMCSECRRPSLMHLIGVWFCYRCGAGGKVYTGADPDEMERRVRYWWGRATNAVQWKAPHDEVSVAPPVPRSAQFF